MRKLSECKNYFKDLLFNCLDENGFDKRPFDCTERAQYETLVTTLKLSMARNLKIYVLHGRKKR